MCLLFRYLNYNAVYIDQICLEGEPHGCTLHFYYGYQTRLFPLDTIGLGTLRTNLDFCQCI